MSPPKNNLTVARVEKAFRRVPRQPFLPPSYQEFAGVDRPLPIGFEQTNSQPTTVRLMLQWLAVKPGDKVLDIGAGSGWTTALLGYLTGSEGHVYAVERIPELVKTGEINCRRAGCTNVSFHQAGKQLGLSSRKPYDRILVSAAAKEVPQTLLDQLAPGGCLVIPVEDTIYRVQATKKGYNSIAYPGFAFVPLRTDPL